MPAVAESAPLVSWQFLLWGAVLVLTVATTVFAVRIHAGRGDAVSPDPAFWDIFGGVAVAFPALLIPSLASPVAGLALTAAAGATGIAAYRGSPRFMAWQDLRRRHRLALPASAAASVQHDQLLARWQRYELDPALGIDYPDMTDVQRPETAAFIRAMREAATLRTAPGAGGYPSAVTRLGHALAAAEAAAGVTGPAPRTLSAVSFALEPSPGGHVASDHGP
ncbi:hypothetical protein [Pseudarthrobacter sp. N5]|uniref:hypothetical protein n=1 Tax=Pseudarthrobacter sp. N5 TaxID=3418416 RepID=UPI003CE6AC39